MKKCGATPKEATGDRLRNPDWLCPVGKIKGDRVSQVTHPSDESTQPYGEAGPVCRWSGNILGGFHRTQIKPVPPLRSHVLDDETGARLEVGRKTDNFSHGCQADDLPFAAL
jgi:hypothetical protein